jgi:hypothetical protein
MVGVSYDATGPVQAPQQPDQPPADPGARGRRRLWITLISAWALLLLVLAVWSARNDPPSVLDQTTLADAKVTIDTVAGDVIGAVPVGWQFQDEGYDDGVCELSLARDGAATVRTVTVVGPEGGESGALRAIGEKLAARMKPTSGPATSFSHDAGNYVLVRGKVTGPGTLEVVMSSGCRAQS